jgi:hypothetical protein
MNFNLAGVILIMAGSVFLYSAVKDKKPQDLVRDALKGGIKTTAGADRTPGPDQNITPVQGFENRSGL